eukprot:1518312-Prymnesium_polylepis.1
MLQLRKRGRELREREEELREYEHRLRDEPGAAAAAVPEDDDGSYDDNGYADDQFEEEYSDEPPALSPVPEEGSSCEGSPVGACRGGASLHAPTGAAAAAHAL